MNKMLKLNGLKILITGGSSKLGRLLVETFKKEGAHLCITYNSSKPKTKIPSFKADIYKLREIRKVVAKTAKEMGGIDILINNAAIFKRTPIENLSEKEWNQLLNINLRASFFFIKESLKYLKKSASGKIINISDTYGASPSAKFVPYGISKAGVIAMTKGLAKELAPKIKVNCICPGVIDFGKKKTDKKAISANLMRKMVKPNDILKGIFFLLKNESITGQSVFIDGGKNV